MARLYQIINCGPLEPKIKKTYSGADDRTLMVRIAQRVEYQLMKENQLFSPGQGNICRIQQQKNKTEKRKLFSVNCKNTLVRIDIIVT